MRRGNSVAKQTNGRSLFRFTCTAHDHVFCGGIPSSEKAKNWSRMLAYAHYAELPISQSNISRWIIGLGLRVGSIPSSFADPLRPTLVLKKTPHDAIETAVLSIIFSCRLHDVRKRLFGSYLPNLQTQRITVGEIRLRIYSKVCRCIIRTFGRSLCHSSFRKSTLLWQGSVASDQDRHRWRRNRNC